VIPPGPGSIGGGFGERIWQCPKCKREVGRGPTPPALVSCCGTEYVNGQSRGRSGIPLPWLGGSSSSSGSSSSTPVSSDSGSSSGTGRLIALGIGVVVFGLAILGGVIFLVVQSQKGGAAPARRRRPRYDDRDRDRDRDRDGRYHRERY
jgi:hypothetical protein